MRPLNATVQQGCCVLTILKSVNLRREKASSVSFRQPSQVTLMPDIQYTTIYSGHGMHFLQSIEVASHLRHQAANKEWLLFGKLAWQSAHATSGEIYQGNNHVCAPHPLLLTASWKSEQRPI